MSPGPAALAPSRIGPTPVAVTTRELLTRWALSHGVVRALLTARAARGDRDARLLRAPDVHGAPWEHYHWLRSQRPFAPGPLGRLTGHHDVVTTVLRSDDFGVVDRTQVLPAPARAVLRTAGPRRYAAVDDPPSMLAIDPPDHARLRRLVSRAFTAKAVAALRTRTEEIASELLDDLTPELRAGAPVDLVARYAALVPLTVIAEMLGVPAEMRTTLLHWGDAAAASIDLGLPWRRYAAGERSLASFDGWLRSHLEELRRQPDPGDHALLPRLVAVADDDGSGLSEQQLVSTAMLVLAAGFETTVNLIGNGTALLFAHPDQRAVLAEDPALWPNAVDEVLRVDSPVQRTARSARRDTVVDGVPVERGEIVVTVLGAANRDPAVFVDPDRFDVARPNARDHVSFSNGLHYCLGAALARMEGEVALRALFTRFPDLAPAGAPTRRPTLILRGYTAMPVRASAA